jgi:hypothetical protein
MPILETCNDFVSLYSGAFKDALNKASRSLENLAISVRKLYLTPKEQRRMLYSKKIRTRNKYKKLADLRQKIEKTDGEGE